MQPPKELAALIGDMVGSRQARDRLELQEQMSDVFDQVHQVTGVRPAFTIGDEFQARFVSMAEATLAALQLHLRSWGTIRLRIGIGWGELLADAEKQSPFGEDGPCWWRAREAIETLHRATRGRSPTRRTMARTETPLDTLLNNYLLLRDTVMDDFDEIDARLAVGLLNGRTQSELANELGMNKSSVSRRSNNHGVLAVVEASTIGNPPLLSPS